MGRGPNLSEPEGFLRAVDRLFDMRCCLHPDAPTGCSNTIIKAHTIQKSGGLARIADEGRVLRIEFFDNLTGGGLPEYRPKLVGMGQASTFTGFCGTHDRDTFAPLERQPFAGTDEQVFLLGYRALCHELLGKRIERTGLPLERDVRAASPYQASGVEAQFWE